MSKADVHQYKTYAEIKDRLSEIAQEVKSSETSLEQSLDLLDEAVVLGSKIVDLVDKTDFTEEEAKNLEELKAETSDGSDETIVEETSEDIEVVKADGDQPSGPDSQEVE